MNLENRSERLYGLGAAVLGAQFLFLYALVSAPAPLPLDIPYRVAVLASSVCIPASVIYLGRLYRKEDTRLWVMASISFVSAAVSLGGILWHLIGRWALTMVLVAAVLIVAEDRMPLETSNPALDPVRRQKVREMLRRMTKSRRNPVSNIDRSAGNDN